MPEGGFPQRFPSSRRGIYSFTSFYSHTHRRWVSIGSRGTAAGRDRPGGGGSTGSQGVNAAVLEGVQVTLRKRCAVLGLPLERAIRRTNLVPRVLVPMLITYSPPNIGLYTARRVDGL